MKKIIKKLIREKDDGQVKKYVDKVNLGMEGWKMRYYNDKFHISPEDMHDFM